VAQVVVAQVVVAQVASRPPTWQLDYSIWKTRSIACPGTWVFRPK
jgi:hypothetical protein